MLKSKEKLLNEYYASSYHLTDTTELKKELNKIKQIIGQIEKESSTQIKHKTKENYLQQINRGLMEILKDVPLNQQNVSLFNQQDLQFFVSSLLNSPELEQFLELVKANNKKAWKIKKAIDLITEVKTSSYISENIISKSEHSGNTTYFKIVEGTMKPIMLSDFAVAIRTNTIAQLAEFKQCLLKHDLDVNELANFLDQNKIDFQNPIWQHIEDKLRRSWSETNYKTNRIFIEKLLAKIQQKR